MRPSLRTALITGLVGAVLAAMSHPSVAAWIVAGLGEAPRRGVSAERLLALATHHLALAGIGLALVASLGLGLGILATRAGAASLRGGIDGIAAAAQAVPPVVMVALALPVLGFGGPPTLLALVAYGIMPVLRGTVGALESVSPEAREAAQAMGFTRLQILLLVELPLAMPGLVDALRTALVLAIATTAVGALAGASTLGTPIVAGLQNQNVLPMLQGALATAALAFLCDAAMLALASIASADRARR
ncbi:ABC transporter permease subunit [Methylobacterium sp. Leaf93]|uniref:ABC transporter permease n=1 Tax=Methylobacterium sp. Leaf93 TaxID=1736249 RepID=UPI00070152C4|nr:ABC transporter permease subunit [Methylobacterium sp. Leaf93]KQP07095.1 ABC transporter permease [Methylobacterium sp. Leaf93]